jgi:hypothetical protein
MTTTYPPTCARNVSIVCVRGIPPGPMRVTLPRAPPMPYSRVATGKLYCFERMLKISYCDAPLRSRRLHLKDKYMRSCRSTKSEPDSEPDLSSSMNGSPILAMLSCVWNESQSLRRENTTPLREWVGGYGVRRVSDPARSLLLYT